MSPPSANSKNQATRGLSGFFVSPVSCALASDVLCDEFDRMPNSMQKQKVLGLYSSVSIYIEINDAIIGRAKEFQGANIKPFDALHLASAEYGGADILRFLGRAAKSDSRTKVSNPVIWITEVIFND